MSTYGTPTDSSQIYRTLTSFHNRLKQNERDIATARLYDVDEGGLEFPIIEPLQSNSGHIKLRVLDSSGEGYQAEFYLERDAWEIQPQSITEATEDVQDPPQIATS